MTAIAISKTIKYDNFWIKQDVGLIDAYIIYQIPLFLAWQKQ